MTIIEIEENRFINLNNIFKFDIIPVESNKCYIRFHNYEDSYANSMEFDSIKDAREWIKIRILRAANTNEILEL